MKDKKPIPETLGQALSQIDKLSEKIKKESADCPAVKYSMYYEPKYEYDYGGGGDHDSPGC